MYGSVHKLLAMTITTFISTMLKNIFRKLRCCRQRKKEKIFVTDKNLTELLFDGII